MVGLSALSVHYARDFLKEVSGRRVRESVMSTARLNTVRLIFSLSLSPDFRFQIPEVTL